MPGLKARRAATAKQDVTATDGSFDRDEAGDLVTAYAKAYERRSAKGDGGQAFTAPEQNALAAVLAVVRHARIGKESGGERALAQVDTLTTAVLEQTRSHSAATDIAGFAWARAFGALPLANPAQAHLSWVLESGTSSGAIKGVYASGWRTLFLLAAVPQLSWQTRRVGEIQLARWRGYFAEKLTVLAAEAHASADAAAASQAARLAFLGAAAGAMSNDGEMLEAARTLLTASLPTTGDGCTTESGEALPTAHCAQYALAAHVIGDHARRDAVAAHLLTQRRHAESGLLAATPDVAGRAELSPWAPLAVAVSLADPDVRTTRRPLLFGQVS